MSEQLKSNFTFSDLPRQEQLRAWIFLYGPSFSEIARQIGVTPKSAIALCKAETAPPYRVEQLKSLGLPEDLLPEPKYIVPGPKPKRREG